MQDIDTNKRKIRARTLRKEIETLESQLAQKKRELETPVKTCPHEWSDPIYDPIYEKGCYVPEWK